jgi:hypothetical protein
MSESRTWLGPSVRDRRRSSGCGRSSRSERRERHLPHLAECDFLGTFHGSRRPSAETNRPAAHTSVRGYKRGAEETAGPDTAAANEYPAVGSTPARRRAAGQAMNHRTSNDGINATTRLLGASLIDPVRCERGLEMPAQLRSRCIQFKLAASFRAAARPQPLVGVPLGHRAIALALFQLN